MARPVTQEMLEAAKRAFDGVAEAVELSEHDREAILGNPEGQHDRMAMLLGVFDEAGKLVGDGGAWLKAPNHGAPFEGEPPLAFILKDPAKNLPATLKYLGAAYGGWA
jgi:hypothetical protein